MVYYGAIFELRSLAHECSRQVETVRNFAQDVLKMLSLLGPIPQKLALAQTYTYTMLLKCHSITSYSVCSVQTFVARRPLLLNLASVPCPAAVHGKAGIS